MQGSGYLPRPVGKPVCHAGDADCEQQGNGIGLSGLCTSGWRIRYLSPPEDIVNRACDLLEAHASARALRERIAGAQDAQELWRIHSEWSSANLGNALAYRRELYEIALAAQAGIVKRLSQQSLLPVPQAPARQFYAAPMVSAPQVRQPT